MKEKIKAKLKFVIPVLILLILIVTVVRLRTRFEYAGTIEATKVDLPARLNTVIKAKNIKEGDVVNKGQALYLLADEEYKIAAESARKDFERAERLYKLGSLPQEAYEHQKTKRDDTALRWEWSNVSAPIDGTILSTYKEIGEWVSPGMKLLTLANLDEVWAIVYVEQGKVVDLNLGQKINGTLPEVKNKVFDGAITWIGSEAEFTPKNVQTREERSRLVFPVKITFKNPGHILKPGMTIEVKL